jgi:prepilin-type N-terminal cleavage/methylation domain-containing protein
MRKATTISAILFVVLLVLPIALVFFYFSINQSLTNQASVNQETITDLTANAIKIKLDKLVALSTSIASVDTLSSQMAAGNWNAAAAAARDLENSPVYYDPYIDRISIYDTQGVQQSAYPQLIGAIGTHGASGAWYQPLVAGAPFYIDHVIERLSMPRIKVFNIAVPVSYKGANVGYLNVQIPIENFLGFSVSDLSDPYTLTYIVDQNGNLISDPHGSDGNGEPVSFASVPAVGYALAGQSGVMISSGGLVQIPSLISYSPIVGYNWGIVTESPVQATFAERDSILSLIMFGIMASLFFDVIISYILWSLLMRKPIDVRRSAPQRREGFTLVELMVVIAIIAVLGVVVVLTLNPAELLRQARDSNRISDLGVLKIAVSLTLVDGATPNLASSTLGYGGCYISAVGANATTSPKCGVFAGIYTADVTSSVTNYRNINSTGWVPVNFSQLSYGSPFGELPVDPVNSLNYYYAYAASSSGYTYEIDAFMESKKYGNGGSGDVVTNDGGDNTSTLEVGNKGGLSL